MSSLDMNLDILIFFTLEVMKWWWALMKRMPLAGTQLSMGQIY